MRNSMGFKRICKLSIYFVIFLLIFTSIQVWAETGKQVLAKLETLIFTTDLPPASRFQKGKPQSSSRYPDAHIPFLAQQDGEQIMAFAWVMNVEGLRSWLSESLKALRHPRHGLKKLNLGDGSFLHRTSNITKAFVIIGKWRLGVTIKGGSRYSQAKANSLAERLIRLMFARFSGKRPHSQKKKRELKFLKPEKMWDSKNPLAVRINIKERVNGRWKDPQQAVRVALVMKRSITDERSRGSQLIDIYDMDPQPNPGATTRDLFFMTRPDNRASYMFGIGHSTGIIRLEASDVISPVSITGTGSGLWKMKRISKHAINIQKLIGWWYRAAENMTDSHKLNKLVANIQAVAYEVSEGKIKALARSPMIGIFIDHYARILSTDNYVKKVGGIEVIRGKGSAANLDEEKEPLETAEHELLLIPYYAWAHRGTGEMDVWLARNTEAIKAWLQGKKK